VKIIVLDGYAMNPGDLSWEPLKRSGEVTIYDRTPVDEVRSRIAEADIALTNKAVIHADAIEHAARLKYIGVMATGYNVVDIKAARRQKITVTNVPAYSTASVAQLTFGLILELANHVSSYAESVKNDDWIRSKDFSYQVKPIIELQNKVLGIVGLGKIGQAVAAIALAFGMKVTASHKHPERDRMAGVNFVDEETLFRESDIVSLHCPLNEQNKAFVNRSLLAMMKPTAFLINTSRGPLIQEQDLADALNNRVIAGAGLDVLSAEPPSPGNPLFKAKNCIITPHIGWATFEARSRLMDTVAGNIRSFLKGEPVNVIT
jgi:glycerate dehydrogenase